MATKSFTTDFRIDKSSIPTLIKALENTSPSHHRMNHSVEYVTDKKEIDSIMKSILKK